MLLVNRLTAFFSDKSLFTFSPLSLHPFAEKDTSNRAYLFWNIQANTRLTVRKLKIFGIICLLSYCTAFVAFATSTMRQPQASTPPVAKTSPPPTTEILAAPLGIGAKAPTQISPEISPKALPKAAHRPEATSFGEISEKVATEKALVAAPKKLQSAETEIFSRNIPSAQGAVQEAIQRTDPKKNTQNISTKTMAGHNTANQNARPQHDLVASASSLGLPFPLNASAPKPRLVKPSLNQLSLAQSSLPQPVKTSAKPSDLRATSVQKPSESTKKTDFSVPLPSGESMGYVENQSKVPAKHNRVSTPPSGKVNKAENTAKNITTDKTNPLVTSSIATSGQGTTKAPSAPQQVALIPIPSSNALVDAVSLQPQQKNPFAQAPQGLYQLQLAIPKMFSASSEHTLASARQTNPAQLHRNKQSVLRSIFPVSHPVYLEKKENQPQPAKNNPWKSASLLPLGSPAYASDTTASAVSIGYDETPMVSKLENDQPLLPLPSQDPQDHDIVFPMTYHHSSASDFYEAAQSLQSITITQDLTPAPPFSPTGLSSLPIPAIKTPMKNQPTASHQADKKKTFQLTNGLKVILQQDDRFPLVSLRLYVHAGSAYETLPQAGISHVLEHMVFKGSRHYGDGEIAREVENKGGYLNAFTSFDQTGYVVDLPSSQWEKGLSVLKEMAFLPLFNADHLASEKEVIVSELKRGKDSPGNVLFTQMIADMFSQSPYAHPIIGFEDTIRAMTVEDLNVYHQQWYQPQSMILVVCGNIGLEQAEKQITKEFSEFTNDKALTPPKRDVTAPHKPAVNIQTGPWQKVRLTLAFHAPSLKDNKAVHLDLLTHMIGGDQTSPLFKKYKYDKRLVDSISMQNYSFEESGLVFVMATLDPQNIKPFWQELLRDMQRGFVFEKEDLARAQLALQDSFYRSRETLEGYASQIGHFNFYFNGEADAQNYLTNVANSNLAMLTALYTEVFQPQSAGIFGITPVDMPFEGDSKNQGLADWLVAELDDTWQSTPSVSAEKSTVSPSEQEVITLENGCSLVLLPDPTLPYISATLLFDGGENLLTPSTQGLGALTAGTLTRGTATRDYNAIQTFLSERAATLTASSNRQTFGLSFSAPSQFTHDLFELARDVIDNPQFSSDETDRVKENIQAAIIRSEEQPISLAFRHLTAFLYPNHSYGFLQLGTPESIASFTHKSAQEHWTKQRSYPWTLSLCGDFSKDDILALVQKLPKPSKTLPPLATPTLTQKRELSLELAEREQAHLFLAFPIPGTNSPDEASLELLTNILAGQSGLLFSELRDKQGLGYSVTAFPWKTQKAGALIFYIGTEPKSVDVAYEGFTTIIDALKRKLLKTPLLERGKNILAGEYYRDRQSLGARSSESAAFTALGLPLNFKLNLIEESQSLTAEDIQRVAQEYLQLEKSFIIKVLPKNTN